MAVRPMNTSEFQTYIAYARSCVGEYTVPYLVVSYDSWNGVHRYDYADDQSLGDVVAQVRNDSPSVWDIRVDPPTQVHEVVGPVEEIGEVLKGIYP